MPASATFPYQLTFDDDEVLGALLTSESYVEGMDNTCNESSWCVLQRFVVPPAGYSAVLSCPTQKLVENGHLTSYFLMFKFSEGWFHGTITKAIPTKKRTRASRPQQYSICWSDGSCNSVWLKLDVQK